MIIMLLCCCCCTWNEILEQTSTTGCTVNTHPAIFNQSSQKSVCLKYLGSCRYYSKTRTCRSTADIFCRLLATGLLRAKKERQKCIKVVFYFGKLNDLDPRSLSQFQLTQLCWTQNKIVKSAGIIENFHHRPGPTWLVLVFSACLRILRRRKSSGLPGSR